MEDYGVSQLEVGRTYTFYLNNGGCYYQISTLGKFSKNGDSYVFTKNGSIEIFTEVQFNFFVDREIQNK